MQFLGGGLLTMEKEHTGWLGGGLLTMEKEHTGWPWDQCYYQTAEQIPAITVLLYQQKIIIHIVLPKQI